MIITIMFINRKELNNLIKIFVRIIGVLKIVDKAISETKLHI